MMKTLQMRRPTRSDEGWVWPNSSLNRPIGSDDADAGSIVACPGMSPFSAADANSDGEDSAGGWDGPAPSATKAASGWDEEKDLRWVEWSDGDLPSAPGIRYYHVLSRV